MAVVLTLELPLLILLAGIACALIAWLLGNLYPFPSRLSLSRHPGPDRFPAQWSDGLLFQLNSRSASLGDWLAGKPMSFLFAIGGFGYLVFGFLGCWTAVRVGGRLDRKHTLSVLYNLVKEHKKRDASRYVFPSTLL